MALGFTFKREAIWIVILSIAPVIVGILMFVIAWISRLWRN